MNEEESETILTGGAWQPGRGGVLTWVRHTPDPSQPRSVAGLIACPTCHARVDQHCQTRTGRTRAPHATRLIAKRCECGARLRHNKHWCDECRVTARRETWRLLKQRYRAARRTA